MAAARDPNPFPPKNASEIQGYLQSLFQLNRGRYEALTEAEIQSDPQADTLIQNLLQEHQDPCVPITIPTIYRFEAALLRMEAIAKIRRMAWNWRSVYRALVGPSHYDLYLKSNPPDPQGRTPATGDIPGPPFTDTALAANESALRADMQILTGEIYRNLALIPHRERLRNAAAQRMGVLLIIFGIGVTAIGSVLNFYHKSMWVIFPVGAAGAMGAFISVQRRLQSLPTDDNATVGFFALYHGQKSLLLGPIAGVMFSCLLYLIFSAGMIKGDVFPKIYNGEESLQPIPAHPNYTDSTSPVMPTLPSSNKTNSSVPRKTEFIEYSNEAGPASGTDWAKLLVWSFLAGFAEQLVPDILNRISSKQATIAATKEVKTG